MLFLFYPRNILFYFLVGIGLTCLFRPYLIIVALLCFVAAKKLSKLFQTIIANILSSQSQSWTKSIYIPMFKIMGCLAKADGKVSHQSIQSAEKIMKKLTLTPNEKKLAIQAFNEGKSQDFDLQESLGKLQIYLLLNPQRQEPLLQMIVQYGQTDGRLSKNKRKLLHVISSSFGQRIFNHHHAWQQTKNHNWQQQQWQNKEPSKDLAWAYQTLDTHRHEPLSAITKKYRKMLSKYHPDRLTAKNASAAEIKHANSKTHDIKQAYDILKAEHANTS